MFGALPILCNVGLEMLYVYISIRALLKPISKSFTPDFRTENMVSFKENWS